MFSKPLHPEELEPISGPIEVTQRVLDAFDAQKARADRLEAENAALVAGITTALERYEQWRHPAEHPHAAVAHIADALREALAQRGDREGA